MFDNHQKICSLIQSNRGIICVSEVLKMGISKQSFYAFAKRNDLERMAQGVYVAQDAWVDALYILTLRYKEAIVSHDTALFLHGLTDREPVKWSVTFKTGTSTSLLIKEHVKTYTVQKNLFEVGLSHLQTTFGNTVRGYDLERTICDIIRSKRNIEAQVFQDALKNYALSKEKDLHSLMLYAEKFHIQEKVHTHLEVLL